MSLTRLSPSLPRRRGLVQSALICLPSHNTFARRLATPAPLNDPEVSPANAPTVNTDQLSQLKRPTRGGQDLSRRHERLERSLRGKSTYGREILDLQDQQQSEQEDVPYTPEENTREATTKAGQKTQRIFKGYVIPQPPKPPAEDECCMSGCAVCVYDLYDEARQDYIHALDKLRANLDRMGVPEAEWPADIRREQRSPEPSKRQDVVLSAFEQFEKALKEKKERERRQAIGEAPAQESGGGENGGSTARSEGQYTAS
ncbi:oxidoreductase-like protein [Trametes polyzona]|nr:oxidoreductase-like protein [Trametes polyzona]